MADYVAITDAEITTGVFLRPAFGRKLRDNFANLNTRVLQQESWIRVFDHFVRSETVANTNAGAGSAPALGDRWRVVMSGTTPYPTNCFSCPAPSVLRISPTVGSALDNRAVELRSRLSHSYVSTVRPLIFEGRFRLSTSILTTTSIGFGNDTFTRGIVFGFPDASNYRFSTLGPSGSLASANIPRPASGTWFTVKINLTDTPSPRAECYVNGALVHTFLSMLPTDDVPLSAHLYLQRSSVGSEYVDVDRLDYGSAGILDTP